MPRQRQRLAEVPEDELADAEAVIEEVQLEPMREPQTIEDAVDEAVDDETRRREAAQRLWRSVVCMIGLVPFPFTGWPFSRGWMGWLVFLNGVATHGAWGLELPQQHCLRFYDIAVNVALCVVVNVLTAWQPATAVLTAFALSAYLANSWISKWHNAYVHVVFVQWPLCAALFAYEYG